MTRATFCLLQGHVLEAAHYNLNIFLFFPLLLLEGILMVSDLIHSKLSAYNLYILINRLLYKPAVFIPLIAFELFVWIRNICLHI